MTQTMVWYSETVYEERIKVYTDGVVSGHYTRRILFD